MPAPISFRPSDLPSIASAGSSSTTADSPSFSDALKSAQSKTDTPTDSAGDSTTQQLSAKTKPKHAVPKKARKDAADAKTPDADTPEDSQAEIEGTHAGETAEADGSQTPGKAADQTNEPAAPTAAEVAAVISQTVTINAVQVAATKKPLPQSGSAPDEAAVTADVTGLFKRPKDALKPAEGVAAPQVAAKTSPESPKQEAAVQDAADATKPPAPLAITNKPAHEKQEKIGTVREQQQQQQAGSVQTPAAASPQSASATLSTDTEKLSSLTSAAPDHENSPAAHDSNTPTLGTAHTQSHPSTSSADSAGEAQDLPPPDRDQTFDQILLGLRGKLDARNGKAEIHLNPPNLGTLHVSINLDKGNLTAQFQSENSAVRDLLKGHMEKLKTVLEASGVSVDKLSVESPTDAPAKSANAPQSGTANHDGRSAGQYTQDQPRKRSDDSGAFARHWQSAAADQTPLDLVA